MARLKRGWSDKGKDRSIEDIGGAISFNIWQVSGQAVLDLENEGFQTDTHSQRLDVISEFTAYLIQVVDRLVYDSFDQNDRNELVTAVGLHLARIMQDNRIDANGPGQYTNEYLQLLNQRIGEYSTCQFDESEGPSFVFLRLLGDHVTSRMGERDAKWITGYIIDIVGKQMFKSLNRLLPGLLDPAQKEASEEMLMRRQNMDQ
ncbi:MAG: hypothetical protein OEY09_14335 [Gammaproteobacteria bacterium]|nr:hypothetical protein [Gammaproteobacteria bacterium]